MMSDCRATTPNRLTSNLLVVVSLFMPLLFWPMQARSSCYNASPAELFEMADVVFAAELDFTAIRFIETEFESGYYKYPFFDYKTVHVWKGQPDERGTAFLGPSDVIVIYDQPGVLDADRKYAKELAATPRELRLYYADETEIGLRYGGCEDVPLLDYAFTYRLQLGDPVISYDDEVFPQLNAKDIFDFFDSMDRVFKDEMQLDEYHIYVKDGVKALLQLDQQEAMFNYLLSGSFMDCPANPAVSIVVSALIAALPEYSDDLFDRFFQLLSCGEPAAREALYEAFAKHASSSNMHALVDRLLQDPSDVVLISVSASFDNFDTKAYSALMDRSILMLDSENSDERMFAAMLLHENQNAYIPELERVSRLCAVRYAEWRYSEHNFEYLYSTSKICQDELRSYQNKTYLTPAEQLLLNMYYIDPGY